jgi:hypothetical protein
MNAEVESDNSTKILLKACERKNQIIRDLLDIRILQHSKRYTPGWEQRVNEVWARAEKEVA